MHEAPPPPRQWNAGAPRPLRRGVRPGPGQGPGGALRDRGRVRRRPSTSGSSSSPSRSSAGRARRRPTPPRSAAAPSAGRERWRRPSTPPAPLAGRAAAAGLAPAVAACWRSLGARPRSPPPSSRLPARRRPDPSRRDAPPATLAARGGRPGGRPRPADARSGRPGAPTTPRTAPAPGHRRPPQARPAPTADAGPVAEGRARRAGEGVTPPRRISGDSASYPDRAPPAAPARHRRDHLIVDENGCRPDLEVVESAGAILDEVVLDAVARLALRAGAQGRGPGQGALDRSDRPTSPRPVGSVRSRMRRSDGSSARS